jgi:hypothetical protein
VCRGWRAVMRERSLWLRLDLSEASGGLARPATDALLRAAAARADGQLHSLDASACQLITHEALLAVLAANAGALRQLRVLCAGLGFMGLADAQSLLLAAPQLRVLDAELACERVADAQRALRNEGAWALLRLHKIKVKGLDGQNEAAVLSVAADLAAHASLEEAFLVHAPLDTAAALDAVVAAALAGCFASRTLCSCRANTTLTWLALWHTALWRDPAVALTLLGAVSAHRSLRQAVQNLIGQDDAAQGAAGAALGALLAADAPTLLDLDLRDCGLREAALGPLVEALRANTHLRELLLADATASEAFLRQRLLPAVRANTSLRCLEIAATGVRAPRARRRRL